MPAYVYLLALGATLRITRFITADLLAQGLRDLVERIAGPDSKVTYLVSCTWCASIWVAAAVTPAAYVWGARPWFTIAAAALSISWLVGIAAVNLDED